MNSPTTAPADHPAACAPTHPQSKGWLTAVLRPAGTLDDTAFGRLLAELSATADMVVVDLDAVRIPNLAAFLDAVPAVASYSSTPPAPSSTPSWSPTCPPPPWPPTRCAHRPRHTGTDQSQPDATDPSPSQGTAVFCARHCG
jgi:hypothetical protein